MENTFRNIEPDFENNQVPKVEQKPLFNSIYIFVIGYIGMALVGEFFNFIVRLFPEGTFSEILYAALGNFSIYFMTAAILTLTLYIGRFFHKFFVSFTRIRPYIFGLLYGIALILISAAVSNLLSLFDANQGVNQNESSVRVLITNYPFSSFVWIVLLGPLVEEIMYRLGIFESLRSLGKFISYAVSGLIFGLIHFNIPYTDTNAIDIPGLYNELFNLPTYIISGLGFAYIYEKEGLAASSTAHIFNNLLSFIITLVAR